MKPKTNRIPIDPNRWHNTLRPKSQMALLRLIEGETVVKTKRHTFIKNGKPTGYTKTIVTTYTRPPNVAAVIFALERLYPERFARQNYFSPLLNAR